MKARKYGAFFVAGLPHKNEGMRITRLEWVRKYVHYGAKFALEREPDNEHDSNAIKVKHVLKSGKRITIGYVPNSKKRPLATELAPLMDEFGWNPDIKFQNMLIQEKDDPDSQYELGEVFGMMLRYLKR